MPAITVTVTLRIPPELLEVIDSCRGGVSRNEWMTTALQWAYANRGVVERALEEPSVERLVGRLEGNGIVGPAPAPAEQPEHGRHDFFGSPPVSPREFTPYPKGGK